MTLHDWLIQNNMVATATVATVTSMSDAIVANVAAVEAGNVKMQTDQSITLQALLAKHPPTIDSYNLTDILHYAIKEDYEDLMDYKVLVLFMNSLRAQGKL